MDRGANAPANVKTPRSSYNKLLSDSSSIDPRTSTEANNINIARSPRRLRPTSPVRSTASSSMITVEVIPDSIAMDSKKGNSPRRQCVPHSPVRAASYPNPTDPSSRRGSSSSSSSSSLEDRSPRQTTAIKSQSTLTHRKLSNPNQACQGAATSGFLLLPDASGTLNRRNSCHSCLPSLPPITHQPDVTKQPRSIKQLKNLTTSDHSEEWRLRYERRSSLSSLPMSATGSGNNASVRASLSEMMDDIKDCRYIRKKQDCKSMTSSK